MDTAAVRARLQRIEEELRGAYYEREDVIRGLMVAVLAAEHVVLLGPPGTAKSEISRDLCSRIGGTFFEWELGRQSPIDDLFGPIDIPALTNEGRYQRRTAGKLPQAHVAVIHEIWKCNSSTLNYLLAILNERTFFDGERPQPVPLITLVASSNEMPEDRAELGALWDRFLLRFVVDDIRDRGNFERLLQAVASGTRRNGTRTTITLDELRAAQEAAEQVRVDGVIPAITDLRDAMREAGVYVSPRRWVKVLGIIRAHAWLEGRDAATEDDLLILQHALWDDPAQAATVAATIMRVANPYDQAAMERVVEARKVFRQAMAVEGADAIPAASEAVTKLKAALGEIERELSQAQQAGRSTARILNAQREIEGMIVEIVREKLGLRTVTTGRI